MVRASTGPNQINRRDLNREINIDGNAMGRSSGEVSADIRAVLDSMTWPPGYRYSFGGSTWLRRRLWWRLMAAASLRLRSAVGFS